MKKLIEFHHDKGIDILKLGCTLPNLANICGPSIDFTMKAVAHETFIRKSNNLCKSVVGIDACQLYPYSMCQDMPTGL